MKGMRFGFEIAAMAMAIANVGPLARGIADIGELGLTPTRKQRRGKGQNNRRGKGAVTKPKKRPNRMHISKRVRRKHRRAA